MAALKSGDLVKSTCIDRFARDPTDLIILGRDIRLAGARYFSITEPIVDTEFRAVGSRCRLLRDRRQA